MRYPAAATPVRAIPYSGNSPVQWMVIPPWAKMIFRLKLNAAMYITPNVYQVAPYDAISRYMKIGIPDSRPHSILKLPGMECYVGSISDKRRFNISEDIRAGANGITCSAGDWGLGGGGQGDSISRASIMT